MKEIAPERFLITGRANAGKTLFMLNFSEYMGYQKLSLNIKTCNETNIKIGYISDLKRTMVSGSPYTTKCMQIMDIKVPVLKIKRPVQFIDTTALSSSIHYDPYIREGMAQTLSFILNEGGIILHIIDGNAVKNESRIDDIDMELYRAGKKKKGYMVLVNKCDLAGFNEGLEIIKANLAEARVIKMSALHKKGFDEIRKYVSRRLFPIHR